jgi:serine phosphatase RsbU (regulator of sigma subunit)/CHASE1-domain containing sensor protein
MNALMGAAPNSGRAPTDRWGLPGVYGRWLTLGVVLVVLVLGGLVTVLLYHQADENARSQESDLTTRAARTLTSTTAVIDAGFSGAGAVVNADGTVDQAGFNAFADNVAPATSMHTIAYEPIVADADRVSFEQRIGKPITEIGPDGQLRPAATRPTYTPLLWMHPEVETASSVIGFDVSSDPTRNAALDTARRTGTTAFSAPINRQPDGVVAVFVAQALYRPGAPLDTAEERAADVVGYVTASVPAAEIVDEMIAQAGPGVRLEVTDGGQSLGSTPKMPTGGHRVDVVGGGRAWVVTLQRDRPRHTNALLSLLATLVAAGVVGLILARNRRKTLELRSSARSVQVLGQLSEHLAEAESLDRMADAIATYAPGAVAARRVVVALDEPAHPDALVRRGSGGEVIAGGGHPLLDARRTGHEVVVSDAAELRRRFPDMSVAYAARGTVAVAAIPLHRPRGEIFGVLGLEWSERQRFRQRTRDAITAVAELCQQNVLRVEAQERRRATAMSLSTLGQRLSAVRSMDEVATEVVTHAPSASGAPIVAIGFFNQGYTSLRLMRSPTGGDDRGAGVYTEIATDPAGPLTAMLRLGRRVTFRDRAEIDKYEALRALVGQLIDRMHLFPLLDSTGTLTGLLVFLWANSERETVWNEPGRMLTIADLAGQTMERAQLYHRQHELVIELQRRTLPNVPAIPGLAVAARYLPSSSALGLGGDWYDVQTIGDALVGLVVGDVVGHGIEAIADMTEIRTTVSTLLRTDADLASVASASSALLATHSEEVVFATAVLMVLDLGAGLLRYVRAGHPPPMVRQVDGSVSLLDAAGTTPIGVAGKEATVGEVSLAQGAVVVAYTDGLVERRDETIDVGIERLRAGLAGCADCTDVEALADALIELCLGTRSTDDDTALIVARVGGS